MSLKAGLGPAFAMISFFAWLGGVLLFFGGGLLLVSLDIHPVGSFNDRIYFNFGVGSIAGGLAGSIIYRIFKEKNK